MSFISLSTPLSDILVKTLKSGDQVLLNGIIYTARDAAHKRLMALIEKGEDLPVDLRGQVDRQRRAHHEFTHGPVYTPAAGRHRTCGHDWQG